MGLVGRGEPRLEIHTHDQVVALILEGSEQRFKSMVHGFSRNGFGAATGSSTHGVHHEFRGGLLSSGWNQELVPAESVLALEWGIQWLDSRSVMLGWLMLTNQRVLFFVFIGRRRATRFVRVSIDEMGRLQDETDPTRLKISFESQTVEFTHRKGQEFVANFWELCNAPTRLRGLPGVSATKNVESTRRVVSFCAC